MCIYIYIYIYGSRGPLEDRSANREARQGRAGSANDGDSRQIARTRTRQTLLRNTLERSRQTSEPLEHKYLIPHAILLEK